MAAERIQRRLAAILAADVVGYSRLMGTDEEGTFTQLKAHQRVHLDPIVDVHKGRIVKTTGDGMLIEFASVVDSLRCAIDIQLSMRKHNADMPPEKRIEFRLGINVGDIIVDGGDIYGDGVNVAARLESLAEPGGICVSGRVQEEARGKLDIAFEDVGEQQLKNIAWPVRVFRVRLEDNDVVERPALPLPDKPSIAVLPFANMSGDPEQQYFSDGITEDIITELSRFHSLFIIARNSSFAFKDKSIKVQDIARELGVAYIVEGSVRRAANRVRITAQLIEAGTGNHLWAERYDRDVLDIFALQDEVARSVASTVSDRVETVGRDKAVRLSSSALRAYDLILRAKALTLNYTKADNEQARACAQRAVELDPASSRAHTHLAWCLFYNYMASWTLSRETDFAKSYQLAQRAVRLDQTDSFARAILGIIHVFRREYDEARLQTEKAVDLNPNDPVARRYYGMFLTATGRSDAAIEQFDLAKRQSPFDSRWVPWDRGIAYFTARRYEEAIGSLRQVHDPINEVRGWLAASYAQAGRLQEAKATLDEFLRFAESDMAISPGRRLKDWEAYWHGVFEYQDQKDFDHLFDALRKAGLSD